MPASDKQTIALGLPEIKVVTEKSIEDMWNRVRKCGHRRKRSACERIEKNEGGSDILQPPLTGE
jgi:hypothetical protein